MPRRVEEVCARCHKNWFRCTCGTRFEWEGVDLEEDSSTADEDEEEEEDDLETIWDFDADELGIDPEF